MGKRLLGNLASILSTALVLGSASPAAADLPAANASAPSPEAPAPLQPDPPRRPIRATGLAFGSLGGEIATGLVALASLSAFALPQRTTGWAPDAAHAPNPTFDELSYATAGGAVALGAASYVLTGEALRGAGVPAPYLHALPVLLADIEAVALAEGVTGVLKAEVGRCRPFAWNGTTCNPSSTNDFAAFPSGHTVLPSALAGVHLVELARHPSAVSWFSFVGLELAADATAVFRVGAGAHSPTDVLAGHAIGHLVGAMAALAHRPVDLEREGDPRRAGFEWPTIGFNGKALTVSGAF